jgi:hypothetical protein
MPLIHRSNGTAAAETLGIANIDTGEHTLKTTPKRKLLNLNLYTAQRFPGSPPTPDPPQRPEKKGADRITAGRLNHLGFALSA